jgi:hypothetical protein
MHAIEKRTGAFSRAAQQLKAGGLPHLTGKGLPLRACCSASPVCGEIYVIET